MNTTQPETCDYCNINPVAEPYGEFCSIDCETDAQTDCVCCDQDLDDCKDFACLK
jgi:hypothetical protein